MSCNSKLVKLSGFAMILLLACGPVSARKAKTTEAAVAAETSQIQETVTPENNSVAAENTDSKKTKLRKTRASKNKAKTEVVAEQAVPAQEAVASNGEGGEVLGGADGAKVNYKVNPKAKKPASKKKETDLNNSEGVFTSKTVKNSIGNIKMLAKGTVGSVQLYAVNREEKAIPIYAIYDEFTSTHFCLLTGRRNYRLVNNAGIVVGSRKSETGVQMVYAIPNIARLIVKYDCLKSNPEDNEDIVKVTAIVKNKSKRTEIFGLKQNIDTYLGEQSHPHFATADSTYVDSEVQYRKLDKVKFVTSGNKYAKAQFILDGADVSRPEAVTLANKDMLAMDSWIPSAVTGKNFDSVISYNNSAIAINWESVRLAPQEEVTYVYYIALSTDGLEPRGMEYIASLEEKAQQEKEAQEALEKENAEKDGKEVSEKTTPKADKSVEKPAEKEAPKQEPKKEEKMEQLPVETKPIVKPGYVKTPVSKPEEEKIMDDISVDPEEITDEKLNPDYIQKLLDRINDLESGDESVNRTELIMLNAELDAILMKLGSQ